MSYFLLSLTPKIIEELQEELSLTRLAKTGLFQRIYTGDFPDDLQNDIKLHRAVLDKALIDFFSAKKILREDVEQWLNLENEAFILSCERALLKPELVFKTFHAMKEILKGDKASFRGFGESSKFENK